MTVENARLFIIQSASDRVLRDRLNAADSRGAITEVLTEQGLPFSFAEFGEAYSKLLANSQTAEEASTIGEIKTWWDYLLAAAPD